MTAPGTLRLRAESALELNRQTLARLDHELNEKGPHFVVGQLEAALREANRIIEALLEDQS